jgi:hypothetical protein
VFAALQEMSVKTAQMANHAARANADNVEYFLADLYTGRAACSRPGFQGCFLVKAAAV